MIIAPSFEGVYKDGMLWAPTEGPHILSWIFAGLIWLGLTVLSLEFESMNIRRIKDHKTSKEVFGDFS